MEMIDKRYSTTSGTIHYWTSAQMIPDRPSLVFLPGLSADHRLFDKQLAFFEPICNVLVWDAPAHASSWPFAFNFTLADKARWLDEILTLEGVDAPILVGQSMGGYVGQMYAELFPGKMKGFVVIDSAPLQRKYMSALELWMTKNVGAMYRMYPWKMLVKDGAKGCAETRYGQDLMAAMMLEYDRDHERYIRLVSHGYKILAQAIEADRPYKVDCPIILICGEKDKAGFTKSYNKKWHRETGYPVHWIPNAGHNSNTDAPDEVNRIIKDFAFRL